MWRAAWSEQDELHSLQRWEAVGEKLTQAFRSDSLSAAKALISDPTIASPGFSEKFKFIISTYDDSVLRGVGTSSYPLLRSIMSTFRCETERQMLITAIALKRYKMKHGKTAETLSDLVPEFLAKLPTDFMDGKPLRYRANPDGTFTLYSVGDDGRDDGGDASTPDGKQVNFWNGRDLVWPMPVKEGDGNSLKPNIS